MIQSTLIGVQLEFKDQKLNIFGIRGVALTLFLKQLITSEAVKFIFKNGYIPPFDMDMDMDLSVLETGIQLDLVKDPFEYMATKILLDPTIYN